MSFVNFTGLYQKLCEKDAQKMGNRCCVGNTCPCGAGYTRQMCGIHILSISDLLQLITISNMLMFYFTSTSALPESIRTMYVMNMNLLQNTLWQKEVKLQNTKKYSIQMR